jgi:hypothetical protein
MLDELAGEYLDTIGALNSEAVYVTDKMPHNFMHLGLIALVFPVARIIHCTRDPRDTCLSIYFQNFNKTHNYTNRLEHLGLYYRQYEKLVRHFLGIIGNPIIEVRYEDTVADVEGSTRRLLEFLDLPWDEHCLDFSKLDRHVSTSSYAQVRQPIYTRSVGRWKQYEKHLIPLLEALAHRY